MNPRRPALPVRVPVLALLVLAVLTAGGCVKSIKPYAFEGIRFPEQDGIISEKVWQVKSEETNSSAKSRELVWTQWRQGALPFGYGFKEFSVLPPQSMVIYENLTWHDLFPVFLTIPLWIEAEESVYRSPSTAPSGRRSFTWSPVWTWTKDSGELKDTCEAQSIPLLYSHIELKGKKGIANLYQLEATNYLWSLGPLRLKMNHIPGDTLGLEESDLFVPLLLCSHFSPLLWMDYTGKSKDPDYPDVENRVSIHGPLGGAVWLSHERIDAVNPKNTYKRHGALWGLFGWGQKDGRRVVRVFGISI